MYSLYLSKFQFFLAFEWLILWQVGGGWNDAVRGPHATDKPDAAGKFCGPKQNLQTETRMLQTQTELINWSRPQAAPLFRIKAKSVRPPHLPSHFWHLFVHFSYIYMLKVHFWGQKKSTKINFSYIYMLKVIIFMIFLDPKWSKMFTLSFYRSKKWTFWCEKVEQSSFLLV